MNHITLMQEYERSLACHSWEAVESFIHDDAVFIFSDGTFRGKQEVAQAFRKTFTTIQNEQYSIQNINWLVVCKSFAICIYNFAWTGIIDGKNSSGEGRGTSVLLNTNTGWKIIHEHLGPPPR
jgi:ketosteroid isomerase-like protein